MWGFWVVEEVYVDIMFKCLMFLGLFVCGFFYKELGFVFFSLNIKCIYKWSFFLILLIFDE